MSTGWETAYVFISSTFNDMHAERDFLVKEVFPALRDWCQRRRLRLIDIDLRWGVTEHDALHNLGAVKVCLERIDDCRPFFLCFLGQRRGWVPRRDEVSGETLSEFPGLAELLGQASVTELEILHALIRPLHDPRRAADGERYRRADHAFFFLRDPSYLDALPGDPPQLRAVFTNESVLDPGERAAHDAALERWRRDTIPDSGRPVHRYAARWNGAARSPELAMPLGCPSADPQKIDRWRRQWEAAGVRAATLDLENEPDNARRARAFNDALTRGRLADFRCDDGRPLDAAILADLQAAIAARFPEHEEVHAASDLEAEIDQQELFLFLNTEGYVPRAGALELIDDYVESDSRKVLVLAAASGAGKSMLLANWADRYRRLGEGHDVRHVFVRFAGVSDRSFSMDGLLAHLAPEIKAALALPTDIPAEPARLRRACAELLRTAAARGRLVVILDGLDQAQASIDDLAWIPTPLPDGLRVVVSLGFAPEGGAAALGPYQSDDRFAIAELPPFESLDDRRRLVAAYLSQYLKELDEPLLDAVVGSEGAANPLYLKIVLSELRVFGAFENLGAQIRRAFGNTPASAFDALLHRLETDTPHATVDRRALVALLFGLIATARGGLAFDELQAIIAPEVSTAGGSEVAEALQVLLRQVRPFLATREGRVDFFYDSFRRAAEQRYMGLPGASDAARRPPAQWHRMLASFLAARGPLYPRTVRDHVYHLARADADAELRACLEGGFFARKREAGFPLYEVLDDLDHALACFAERRDAAGLILAASGFRDVRGLAVLIEHEGYLAWLASVLAAADNHVELSQTASYIDRQASGPGKVRMAAEYLVGLGAHPAAKPFRDKHRADLALAAAGHDAHGLDLLAAEALGDVDLAFRLATEGLPDSQRLVRVLRLVRRHVDHPQARAVIALTIGNTQALEHGRLRDAATMAAGLLRPTPAASEVPVTASDSPHDLPLPVRHEALTVLAFLRGSPDFVAPFWDTLARAHETTDEYQTGFLGLAWFGCASDQHPLVRAVVEKRSRGRQLPGGIPSWRGRILQGLLGGLEDIDVDPKATEAMLTPVCTLWARLLAERGDSAGPAFSSWTFDSVRGLVPRYIPAFTEDVAFTSAWVELGQALSCEGATADAATLLTRFRQLYQHDGRPGEEVSDRALLQIAVGAVFIGTVLAPFYVALRRAPLAAAAVLGVLAIIGFAFHRLVLAVPSAFAFVASWRKQLAIRWAWLRQTPLPEKVERFLADQESDFVEWWLKQTGVWQKAAMLLCDAGGYAAAQCAIPWSGMTPRDFVVAFRPDWWRSGLDAELFRASFSSFLYTQPDEEGTGVRRDWSQLVEDLIDLHARPRPAALPAAGLRIVGRGELALPELVDVLRRFSRQPRVRLDRNDIAVLGEALGRIDDEKVFLKNVRALHEVDMDEPHHVAAALLPLGVSRSRKTYAEVLYAVARWKTLTTPALRREMRRRYVACVREEELAPAVVARPIVFGAYRAILRMPDVSKFAKDLTRVARTEEST